MIRSAIKSAPSLTALTTLALLHAATPAGAASKVWVSHLGNDANPCSATLPCASLAAALTAVAAGGEISVLDAGDYGPPFTINKAVSISNDGAGEAGIVNTSTSAAAVTIVAGAGDIVSLRGLVLDGVGAGFEGIEADFIGAVHVQNCVIRNFQASGSAGISMTANNNRHSQLFVSDTIVYNNGLDANSGGILLSSFGGQLNVLLNRVKLENNVLGLRITSNLGVIDPMHVGSPGLARATVRDSRIAGNASDGILAANPSGVGTVILVERTTSVNNAGSGVHAEQTGAVVLLRRSGITNNGSGVSTTNGGHLFSYGNNRNNNNVGPEGTASGMLASF